jgi:catechol 2,3-dioxygenase-like lactoylglutathione lyase family enzyme
MQAMVDFDALTHDWKPLVPELIVSDIGVSLRFWRDVLGFQVLYERPAEGFAYLARERAEVMLEAHGEASWVVGTLERPFGRGINLQIEAESLAVMLDALAKAQWPLYRQPEERWYRTGSMEAGQRQFLVQDPDGYLLRFAQSLAPRPVAAPANGS